MSLQKAIDAVRNIETEAELSELIQAIKLQRTWISNQMRRSLTVGDTVQFDAGARRGGLLTGVVQKINPKKVKVKVGMTVWTVPASMLTRVEDTVDLS